MSQPPVDDDFQDRIQRILNEKKRDDLIQQYGMSFEQHSEDMSPQLEGEWLDYITEFERQFENARQISVRERIGNPKIRLLVEIPDSELEAELERIFELLDQHNIAIDFLHEQDDREIYRFITEELLAEMTDDMQIPGMVSHFIYEEFHPNDEDDITQSIDEFLYGLFKAELKDQESMFYTWISKETMHGSDGEPLSFDDFKGCVDDFYEAYPVITEHTFEVNEIMIDSDAATTTVTMEWHGIPKDHSAVIRRRGISCFRLTRSVYGGWDIIQAQIPGFSQRFIILISFNRLTLSLNSV